MSPPLQPDAGRGAAGQFLAAAAISVALSWLILAVRFPGTAPALACGGLIIVLTNGALAHGLYHLALRSRSSHGFLLWSLGGSLVRSLLLMLLLAACHHHMAAAAFTPLLATVLIGYFTFMAFEILHLHLHTQPVQPHA